MWATPLGRNLERVPEDENIPPLNLKGGQLFLFCPGWRIHRALYDMCARVRTHGKSTMCAPPDRNFFTPSLSPDGRGEP